jgi:aldose 1-epimerase
MITFYRTLHTLANSRFKSQFRSAQVVLGVGLAMVCLANQPRLAGQTPATSTSSSTKPNSMSVTRTPFGQTPDGTSVELFTLTNAAGNVVTLTNYGAILVSVEVPDRAGNKANVNLGFSDLQGYLGPHPHFGSTIGRFANRIAGGQFAIDGQKYELAVNNGPNHLHGGKIGFDKQVWQAATLDGPEAVGVRFTLLSPDGQEGYPGNLSVEAEYTWNEENELRSTFRATTDQATVLNLTNHAYWNLAGAGNGTVLEHLLQMNCDQFLEVDSTLIPTGKIAKVAGTPLDFRQPQAIGERIAQLPATKGYDHCFVVNGAAGQLRSCGLATDPHSGRTMEVLTTQPGVQLYTANHLGGAYMQHGAFCLETQHYPDSPNRPEFPTTRLNPGEKYEQTTINRFSFR